MVNLINVEKLSKSYGMKNLFSDVSFGIHSLDKIGIVGLNGTGKSTLLKLISKLEPSDNGRISIKNDTKISYLNQNFTKDSVLVKDILQIEKFENESIKDNFSILENLKIDEDMLSTPTERLSGGQTQRVMIAKTLLSNADILLLDEPTNHLDISAINWLANYLKNLSKTIICVTHDRWFLDAVCKKMFEVVDTKVVPFEGGFTSWSESRAERDRIYKVQQNTKRNIAKREQEWLRTGAKARTSKAKSRITSAEKVIAESKQQKEKGVELASFGSKRQGKTVLEFENASYKTPNEKIIFENIDLKLAPQTKIGIVGNNGTGKTTLINLMNQNLEPTTGKIVKGLTTKIAILTQEIEKIDDEFTILEAIEDVAKYLKFNKKEISASQLATKIGFDKNEQRKKVKILSGGQKRRLQLTRLLMQEPNLLILDEPTNDLDIDTIEQLENILIEWTGTLVIVSHDRYFLTNISDDLYATFGDHKITNLPKGIEEFFNFKESTKYDFDKNLQNNNTTSKNEKRVLEKKLKSIELKLEKVSKSKKNVESEMAVNALNQEILLKLNTEYNSLETEENELQEEWFNISEKLSN